MIYYKQTVSQNLEQIKDQRREEKNLLQGVGRAESGPNKRLKLLEIAAPPKKKESKDEKIIGDGKNLDKKSDDESSQEISPDEGSENFRKSKKKKKKEKNYEKEEEEEEEQINIKAKKKHKLKNGKESDSDEEIKITKFKKKKSKKSKEEKEEKQEEEDEEEEDVDEEEGEKSKSKKKRKRLVKTEKIKKKNKRKENVSEEDEDDKNIDKKAKKKDKSSESEDEDENDKYIKKFYKKTKKKDKSSESENEDEDDRYTKKSYKKTKKKDKSSESENEDEDDKYTKKSYKKTKKKDKSSESEDEDEDDKHTKKGKHSESEEEDKKTRKKKEKKSHRKQKKSSNEEDFDEEEIKAKNNKKKTKKEKNLKDNTEEDDKEKTMNLFPAPLRLSNLTPNIEGNLDDLAYKKIINLIGEYLKIFYKYRSFFPEFMKSENEEIINKFISKYNLFFNIKRFSIPCFGTISCGKSTFINYLLKLHHILETDEDIATKFVCSIRHVKGLKKPKIYDVKFELRDTARFNLEKNKQIKGDVKNIIKERNKFIKDGNGKREPSNYFLIVEADIPIFHGENEKFAEFFEFLDFPGLDEVKEGENTIKENSYFKDFLPLIQPNIMFSLFLFDLNSYESNSGKDILKYYINNPDDYMSNKLKETLYRSMYILNQIDRELKEEKNLLKREEMKKNRQIHFQNKMENNFCEILNIKNLTFNEENSILLSAKILELNEYKFESFPKFIDYINSLEEIKEENNYKNYLEKKMKEILEIKKIDKKNTEISEDSENDEEEINTELEEVNDKLLHTHMVGNKFKLKDYIFYRYIFKKNLKKVNKDEAEDDDIKILIINQIKKCFDYFFNLEEFTGILDYIDKNSNELVEYSKKTEKNLSNLIKNPNSIEYPVNMIENITKQLDKFSTLSPKSKTIEKLKINAKLLLEYIKNQLSMRFIFIGRHNSGKTSLINSFLGIKLLETSAQECTMAGFVIKHIDNISETQIYEGEMKKNSFGYYYFEKIKSLAKGVDNVAEKIKNLNKKEKSPKNKNKNNKDNDNDNDNDNNNDNKNLQFYIIEAPINIFKNIGINKEIYSKIELIDIPGLDTGFEEAINSSNSLLDFTDGFIFVNSGMQLDNHDNRDIIKRIVERISKRPQFSFNTCLFVLTKADDYKIDVNESKKQIQKILAEGFESKSFAEIIRDQKAISNKNNLLVTAFSNILYREYLNMIEGLKKFELLEKYKKDLKKVVKHLREDFMEIDEDEFEIYKTKIQINENDDNYKKIISKLKDENKFSEENILDNKQNIIDIIYISSYILEHNKDTVTYTDSYAKDLFSSFKEQINNSYKIYTNNLKIMCINFFFENLIPLTILKISINKNQSININTENKNQKQKNLDKIQKLESYYNEKIKYFFKEYEKMIDRKISYLTTLIKDNKKFELEIKKVDFDNKIYIKDMYQEINKLLKELNNKITEIIKEFLKDINCDVELQKYTTIQEMATGNLGIGIGAGVLISGGVAVGFGAGAVSSTLLAIEAGMAASLTVPVVGIIVGGVAVIGAGVYLLYRLFKKRSTINKEQITKFENINKKEIRKSENKILDAIKEIISKAKESISFFYSILEENLDEFKKNKELFEKYYFEYENIVQQGFGLS